MTDPSYQDLEKRVKELEKEILDLKLTKKSFEGTKGYIGSFPHAQFFFEFVRNLDWTFLCAEPASSAFFFADEAWSLLHIYFERFSLVYWNNFLNF